MGECQMRSGSVLAQNRAIAFTVYGKPQAKERPRTVNGHTYTPNRTREHEKKIAAIYKSIWRDFKFEKGVPLRIIVDAYFSIAESDRKSVKARKRLGEIRPTSKPDADNVLKTVQDSINGVAFYDDSQIVEATIRLWYADEPKTVVFIERVENEK